jgi:hypothetical protein
VESGAGLEAADAPDGGGGSASVTRNASARWKQMRVVAASAVGKMRGGGGVDDDEAEAAAAAVGQSTTVFFSHLFCLPLPLARSYTQAVFLCRHRLQTTGKRQASLCSYDDLQAIAHILMEKWCPRVGEEHREADGTARGGGGGGAAEAEQTARVLRKPSTSALERQLYSSISIRDDAAGASSATASSPSLLPSPALPASSLSAAHHLSLTMSSPSPSSLTSPASFPVLHLLSSIHPTSSFSSCADDADIGRRSGPGVHRRAAGGQAAHRGAEASHGRLRHVLHHQHQGVTACAPAAAAAAAAVAHSLSEAVHSASAAGTAAAAVVSWLLLAFTSLFLCCSYQSIALETSFTCPPVTVMKL